jgi:hypothetical protein
MCPESWWQQKKNKHEFWKDNRFCRWQSTLDMVLLVANSPTANLNNAIIMSSRINYDFSKPLIFTLTLQP